MAVVVEAQNEFFLCPLFLCDRASGFEMGAVRVGPASFSVTLRKPRSLPQLLIPGTT